MKLKERAEETTAERFVACLGGMNRWATINEFVDALDEANFWDEGFYSKVEDQAKKQFIRRMIRKAKDETDWPVWANVKIQDAATGVEVRVYKQESLFDVADYAQVCGYHHQAGLHHLVMARGYRDRAERRYGRQAAFSFTEIGDPAISIPQMEATENYVLAQES
jgi:hypothetical protein